MIPATLDTYRTSGSDFARLAKLIKQAGLLAPQRGYYATNRHHANPNREDDGPDPNVPALVFPLRQGQARLTDFDSATSQRRRPTALRPRSCRGW